MPRIRPFRAIRPAVDKVHLVVSRSYITYEPEALIQKLDSNPYSFIHVINPDHGRLDKAPKNSPELFSRIRGKFDEFAEEGIFVKDSEPAFYLYEQARKDRSFLGLICASSVEDYQQGLIKKHEHTIAAREEIFKEYLDICDINAEPVLLTYPDNEEVNRIQLKYRDEAPVYDFSTTDRVRHRVWRIESSKDIESLQAHFSAIDSFYIADGHHRSASSSLLSAEKQKETPMDEDAPQRHFMTYLIPESQLRILEFNRLVKDLNGLSVRDLLTRLQDDFIVEECDREQAKPQAKGEMALYIDGRWYGLRLQGGGNDELDSQRCTDKILAPILNLSDLRTDKRIGFIGGQEGLIGIERQVDSTKFALGIALFPVSVEELKSVADRDEVMPPKSTWIEPKLRSGLIIYSLSGS